jgi:hypothetical protein
MKGIFMAWAVAVSLSACTGSAPGPTFSGESVIPAGTVFEIVGPDVVPLGGTVQFNLVAHLPNGSKRDVTNEARWSESVGSVMSLSAPGLLTGRERGDTQVFVEFDRYQKRKDLIVLPAGTFRLMGQVSETDVPSNRVAGARVEVTAGIEAPLVTHTDGFGTYRLYGVSGETSLRVTREGYQPVTRTVVVGNHQTANVELPLAVARANVAGTYRLTITAASHCGVGLGEGNLPEGVRTRSYAATVHQDGASLSLTLSGPSEYSQSFDGAIGPDAVAFALRDRDEGAPIIEWLSTSGVLEISGSLIATAAPNRMVGTLSGTFRLFERSYGLGQIARCFSTSHQLVLSR